MEGNYRVAACWKIYGFNFFCFESRLENAGTQNIPGSNTNYNSGVKHLQSCYQIRMV